MRRLSFLAIFIGVLWALYSVAFQGRFGSAASAVVRSAAQSFNDGVQSILVRFGP
jgi:hypothetical protein